jgi:PhnB protein
MATLNPYLNFPGNAEEAFNFYKSVFGGEFTALQRFKDTPESGRVPEKDKEKIMHIALPIGKGNILMATDAVESMGHKLTEGTNFHLSLNTDSEEETEKLFNALSAGGKVTVPLDKMFWGAYFGMFTDKFGIQWMVNYDYNQQKQANEKKAERKPSMA